MILNPAKSCSVFLPIRGGMNLPRPAEPPGPVVLGEEEPLKTLEERLRIKKNGCLEGGWRRLGARAGCDSATDMKGLGLVAEPLS